jgi:hypothetical protein
MVTGLPWQDFLINRKELKMNNLERNEFTGTMQRKASNDIYNSLTGNFRKTADSNEPETIEKSENDKALWPSITNRRTEISKSGNSFLNLILKWLGYSSPNKYEFQKSLRLIEKSEDEHDEHIVCGIVYEPGVEDSQGDEATAEEIRKAAYRFMESSQKFKLNHQGNPVKASVLESMLAPADFELNGQQVKKGSWVLTLRINDENAWQKIKKGELTGFSMAGLAQTVSE